MIFYESAMLTINYRLCKVEMKEQHNDFTKISLIFAEKLINARLQFVKDILIVILRNVIISFKEKFLKNIFMQKRYLIKQLNTI